MSEINLLSSKIFNRIAAGEVVERPASAVKELVENSIDAGADSISVEISDGGKTLIKITDNGSGIEKTQLKKALLPHATSKISKVEDLDNIVTLGFRGEALASIASVSEITIESKPVEQEIGAAITCRGGEYEDVIDSPVDGGTEITVNNLFYNTPVREKFLKTDRTEENEITSVMARFILGNPDISFKYSANGKTVLQSYGDGLESAVVKVYGSTVIGDCFYIDTEKNGIRIKGYIGKQYYSKPNRSYQTVFINRRYVVNQTISSAVMNAYAPYMMKRQYPFYVLDITMPSEFIDVNVHPNKIDVRFINNQIVYGTLYTTITKVLDGSHEAVEIASVKELAPQNTETETKNETVNDAGKTEKKVEVETSLFTARKENGNVNQSKPFGGSALFSDFGAASISKYNDTEKIVKESFSGNVTDIFAENKAFIEKLEKEKAEKSLSNEQTYQTKIDLNKDFRVVGQVLTTYLILEDGKDLYFIDQHAAHERVLFDKLNEELENKKLVLQPMLAPYVFTVNNAEYNFLSENLSSVREIGIGIEEFGASTFRVSEMPAFLSNINLKKFFDDILSEMDTLKKLTGKEILKDRLARTACRSAIKAGDVMTESEIKCLIEKMKGDMGLKCPHGRPVVVKISGTEIEKWFKRIV